MKQNKGITLISLTIYIIILVAVVGMVSVLIKYFYKNTNESVLSDDTAEQYTLFLAYITDDINSGKINEVEAGSTYVSFTFLDQMVKQYVFDETNQKLYYMEYSSSGEKQKQIALCNDVDENGFEVTYESNKLKIALTINGVVYNNSFNV